MDISEMRKYVEDSIRKQGTASSKVLSPLFSSILDKLAETPGGLVAAPALKATRSGSTATGDVSYTITSAQTEIDEVIDLVLQNKDLAHIAVIVEVSELEAIVIVFDRFTYYTAGAVSARATTIDGEYQLDLTSMTEYPTLCFTKHIDAASSAEIEAYTRLFGAKYDYSTGLFTIAVQNEEFQFVAGDMILSGIEYAKSLPYGVADYSYNWANSVACYIKCHLNLGSSTSELTLGNAFEGCKEVELIDLGKEVIHAKNMVSAFSGCRYLRWIEGLIILSDDAPVIFAFKGCESLEHVEISNLSTDLDLSDCASITPESVEYMVRNAKADTAITITLEASVLEQYNASSNWASVRSAVAANTNITIN